jgi:hypothetical protein
MRDLLHRPSAPLQFVSHLIIFADGGFHSCAQATASSLLLALIRRRASLACEPAAGQLCCVVNFEG